MLTCFDLKPKHSIEEFQKSLTDYTAHMHELDLVESHSSIGLRQSDTILDTDDERKQKYFMLMHFRDREQSDNAVTYIKNLEEPAKSLHTNTYSKTQNLIFISWEDIE
jgi:hypothetical protein